MSWQWVLVSEGDSVDSLVVNTYSSLPIMVNNDYGGCPGAIGLLDDSLGEPFINLLVDIGAFLRGSVVGWHGYWYGIFSKFDGIFDVRILADPAVKGKSLSVLEDNLF